MNDLLSNAEVPIGGANTVLRDPSVESGTGETPENSAGASSMPTARIYGFSRVLTIRTAKPSGKPVLRPKEGVVLSYIAHKVIKSRNERDGRKWFYETVENISNRIFPWIPPKTVGAVLRSLSKKGCILRGNYNRLPADRTVWYSMDQDWLDRAAQDPIYFRVEDAVRWGLCEAVLLHNMAFWIRNHPDEKQQGAGHPMRPRALSQILPFSEATIKRALLRLEKEGAVKKGRDNTEKCSRYQLSQALQGRVRTGTDNGSIPTVPHESPEIAERHAGREFLKLVEQNREALKGQNSTLVTGLANLCAAAVESKLHSLGGVFVEEILRAGSPDAALLVARQHPYPGLDEEYVLPYYYEVFIYVLNRHDKWGRLPRSHDILGQVGYQCRCRIMNWYNQWKEVRREELFRKRQKVFASVDSNKESIKDISPAEKARVLRTGINAKNRCGRLVDGKIVTDYLRYSQGDRKTAERFFLFNRLWTPADVLSLLERCAKEEKKADEAGHDPKWHTRRGFRLRFLLHNLEAVLQEMGLTASMPPVLSWRAESNSVEDNLLPEKGTDSNRELVASN